MTLLVVIALLALNFLVRLPGPTREAEAVSKKEFGGNSSAMACSADGKIVYASDGYKVYRSTNSGQAGSWETVLE